MARLNNYHHMLYVTERVTAGILWANMFLLLCAAAYYNLQLAIIRSQGEESLLREAVGKDLKGKASLALYAVAVPAAFVAPWISFALYMTVAAIWLTPDRRIERVMAAEEERRAARAPTASR